MDLFLTYGDRAFHHAIEIEQVDDREEKRKRIIERGNKMFDIQA